MVSTAHVLWTIDLSVECVLLTSQKWSAPLTFLSLLCSRSSPMMIHHSTPLSQTFCLFLTSYLGWSPTAGAMISVITKHPIKIVTQSLKHMNGASKMAQQVK